MSEHEFNCGYASYFAGVSASDLDDFQASADFRAGWRTARWEEDCDDEAKPDGWWENDHVAHYDPNPEEEDLPPTWEYQFEIWMSQLNCRIHNLYIVGKDPDELPL